MAALDSTENTFPPLFDVGAVWARLWRGRWTVLLCLCGALVLALAYLMVTKPSYTATASLLIDPRDARSTRFETVLPGIGPDSAAVASQVFVIQSRSLLMAVFEAEGIEQDAEFADGGLLSLLGLTDAPEKDAVFRRFERRVTVERAGLTYVIDVSFKSRSAEKAARIANAIVAQYRAGLAGERESANADVNTRLAGRVATLQKNVVEADRAVGDFRVAHELLDPAAGGTLKDQIDQLTTQLIDARAAADEARSRHDQAVAAGTSPAGLARLAQIVSSATIDALRADHNQRAAALANAEAVYQARHPAIRRLRSELAETKALMAAEAGRATQELKAKDDLARAAVATLEAKLSALRGRSQAADAARVELRRLEAKAEAARAVLDDVLKRAEETEQMRGLQLSEARVIGFAAPPVQPSWPTPLLLLPVSAAIGLLAGCGLAVAGVSAGRPPGREAEAAPPPVARRERPARAENLGHYLLPGPAEASTSARIRAMRRRFLQRGGESVSRAMLALVRRIAAQLSEHAGPYRLVISGFADPAAARLAGAMIGIGLQQAGQNVLVVEFGAAGERGADVFVNAASGLPTVVRPLAAGRNAAPFRLDDALAGDFDFVLLLAPPLESHDWSAAAFPGADLMLFALSAAETPADAQGLLRRRLGAAATVQSAMLTLAAETPALPGDAHAGQPHAA